MDLFLGLGILALVLAVLVSPALGAMLEQGQLLAALLTGLAAGLLPLLNLYRYRRAPGGCLALALGFAGYTVAFTLRLEVLTCVLALAAPNLVFACAEPVWRRLRERRALAQVAVAPGPADLVVWLGDPAPAVRERASQRLAEQPLAAALPALDAGLGAPPPSPAAVWSTVDRLPPSAELEAWLRARLGEDAHAPAAARRLAAKHPTAAAACDDPRPAVRLGLGVGFLAAGSTWVAPGCALLVGVLADSTADAALRQEALDALEPDVVPGPTLSTAADVDPAEPTAELLWLWAEHGRPAHAARAATLVAAADYGLANAALEAVHGIVQRGDLGEHASAVTVELQRGVAAIRAVHPPGDNPLADGLVDDLEALRAALTTPPPASADAAG